MQSLSFPDCNATRLIGKISYVHNGHSSSIRAFSTNEISSIRLFIPRQLGTLSASLSVFEESCTRRVLCIDGIWTELDHSYDVYEFPLHETDLEVGLYFFGTTVNTVYGSLYAFKSGYDRVGFSYSDRNLPLFQLSVSDFRYSKPEQNYGGLIYHIFVDRFNRGGTREVKPGTVNDDDWRVMPEYPLYPGAPLRNNHFYGGTLWGIIDKLDYIASLGVNMIYLSPVFDAASNHKYDTADYMNVDSMFGGNEALKELIKRAKEKGIGIILDGVFNHTGADSIYFNREGNYDSLGAYQSRDSEYFSWYDFQDFPNKYTSWWGIDILPRINPDIPSCRSYFTGKGGVVEKYAKMGIAGMRLDVVDELSDSFVESIKAMLNKHNKRSVLYGEVWEDASNKIAYGKRKAYYSGRQLDGVMNYPMRKGIIEYLTRSDPEPLRYALTDVICNAPKRITDMQMNLLGTHDTDRILTVLSGGSKDGRSNDYLAKKKLDDLERGRAKRRLRMAYAILATLPGIPTIFYGDEVGLEGYHDPFNRMPYPWGREDINLLDYYRRIGKIRRENDVYKEGEYELLFLDSGYLVFERSENENAFVTFVNNTRRPITVEFSSAALPLINSLDAESCEFEIPAYSAEIFKTTINNDIEF